MKTTRTNIVFPTDVLEEISSVAGKRQRSRFVVEAVKEKLERVKIKKALEKSAGAWSDKNHPDLKTQEDINRFLKTIRLSTNKRIGMSVDE